LVDLLETGDEIIQIEGILSGTLSFLFNSFSPSDTEAKPQKFSQVVKQAKESGYTVRFLFILLFIPFQINK